MRGTDEQRRLDPGRDDRNDDEGSQGRPRGDVSLPGRRREDYHALGQGAGIGGASPEQGGDEHRRHRQQGTHHQQHRQQRSRQRRQTRGHQQQQQHRGQQREHHHQQHEHQHQQHQQQQGHQQQPHHQGRHQQQRHPQRNQHGQSQQRHHNQRQHQQQTADRPRGADHGGGNSHLTERGGDGYRSGQAGDRVGQGGARADASEHQDHGGQMPERAYGDRRRSPIHESQGNPRGVSQRGGDSRQGVSGHVGGQFGDQRGQTTSWSAVHGYHSEEQFAGGAGESAQGHRFGSRHGHGTRRRENPNVHGDDR